MMRSIFGAILCLSLELLHHQTNAHNDAYCLLRGKPIEKREDYTYFPGVGGYKFHTEKKTWDESRDICAEEGGHLAVMNKPDEVEAVITLFKDAQPADKSLDVAFTGFHDLFREGEYLTIHGQTLEEAGYRVWHEAQPNDVDHTLNCGGIHHDGTYNDLGCEDVYEFICEHPDQEEHVDP